MEIPAVTTFEQSITNYATDAVGGLVELFAHPASFLSPAPLLVAAILAGVVVMRRRRAAGVRVGARAVLRDIFPASIWRHPSARHDIFIILINDGLLFFIGGLAFFAVDPLRSAATSLFGAESALARPPRAGLWDMILFGVYFALVWDFFATFAHYLKHKVPVFWEFHKIHHCAEVLTPLTAMRRHPAEVLISACITGSGIALALIVWVAALGAPGTSLEIGGTAFIVYLWRLLGYNLRHSHIWISYGPFWNRYLMSPAHHQLHHSRDPRHHDCNFGHIFTFWDRLFGTLYQPVEGETFELGIEREENAKLNSLSALYIRPLRRAAALVTPWRSARARRLAE